MRKQLKVRRPDWLILVDYAGFNLHLARYAKQLGIKVCYYIPPKTWASRPSRVNNLKRDVDLIAAILPFEVDYYIAQGLNAIYAGNPTYETWLRSGQPEAKEPSDSEALTVALLPGSRESEIKHHLAILVSAAQLLRREHPNWRFVLGRSASIEAKRLNLTSIGGDFITLLPPGAVLNNPPDLAIAASGTVTLELAIRLVPMVIIYRLGEIEYAIAKRLVKVKWIGLANLALQRGIAPELIQQDCSAKRIAAETSKLAQTANLLFQRHAWQQLRDQLSGAHAVNLIEQLNSSHE